MQEGLGDVAPPAHGDGPAQVHLKVDPEVKAAPQGGVAARKLVGQGHGPFLQVQEVAQGGEVLQDAVGARGEGHGVDGKALLLEPKGLLPLDPGGKEDEVRL